MVSETFSETHLTALVQSCSPKEVTFSQIGGSEERCLDVSVSQRRARSQVMGFSRKLRSPLGDLFYRYFSLEKLDGKLNDQGARVWYFPSSEECPCARFST